MMNEGQGQEQGKREVREAMNMFCPLLFFSSLQLSFRIHNNRICQNMQAFLQILDLG